MNIPLSTKIAITNDRLKEYPNNSKLLINNKLQNVIYKYVSNNTIKCYFNGNIIYIRDKLLISNITIGINYKD